MMRNFEPHTVIDCDQYTTMFPRYIEGKLGYIEKMRLEFHLSYCDRCSERLDDLIEAKLNSGEIKLAKAPFYPSFDLYNLYQQYQEIVAVFQQIEDKAVEIIKEEQRSIFVQYDVGRRVNFRTELIKKLNARSLDNFIDPVASVNGNGAIGIVSAKLLNLSQIRETISTPLIINGSSKELNTLFAEPILEMPINRKENLLKIQLPEEAPAIWQRQAEQVCERLEGIANPREAILAVLDHGTSDEVMPLSWLERMGYLKSNPHPLIEELFEFREVITPINPYLGEITENWEEAQYLTATDGEVARMILERMERWNGRARTDYYKKLINSVITEKTDPLSEDAKLMCRLLYALYLRGWRSTLYHVLSDTNEIMNPMLNKILKEAEDARYLMAWGKVYAKGGDSDTAIKLLNAAEIVAEERDKETLPYILRVRAGLHLDRDERREAIGDLDKARELQPQNITILTALAAVHAREYGPRSETFKIADEAKGLEPDSPYPYQIAGYARMRLGLETSQRRFFAEAAKEFSQALEKDPKNVPTLTAWAEMAMERGHLRP